MLNFRKIALASGLALLASVASAASVSYDFKSFFDTSTPVVDDVATLPYSVAQLTLTDVAGGVQLTLRSHATSFPGTLSLGTLWLDGTWGTLSAQAGTPVSGGAATADQPTLYQDGGYSYNGSVTFQNGGIAEGGQSVFSLLGPGVSVGHFASSFNVPMIEFTGAGAPYATLLSSKVHFIGTPVAAVPEPTVSALMGVGLLALALVSRRSRRAS